MKRRSFLLPALVASLVALAPATAHAAATLQPGAYHTTPKGSCTLNFAYTDGASTYLGTAAHCANGVGDRAKDIDGVEFGTVTWRGDENDTAWDFAFIKVDPEDVSRVSAAVKGYPAYPKGFTVPADTTSGDSIQLSGYGMGYDTTKATQEQRTATFMFDDTSIYGVTGPIHWGDSGGPLVHRRTGKALGIVSRLCVGVCTEEGPTVQGILDKARSRGLSLTLRTV
jgi:hypothetical protein